MISFKGLQVVIVISSLLLSGNPAPEAKVTGYTSTLRDFSQQQTAFININFCMQHAIIIIL